MNQQLSQARRRSEFPDLLIILDKREKILMKNEIHPQI
jgi:hypothetical protein